MKMGLLPKTHRLFINVKAVHGNIHIQNIISEGRGIMKYLKLFSLLKGVTNEHYIFELCKWMSF